MSTHSHHPIVKYVNRDKVETPISQIYSQFPHRSQESIRATLSSAVRQELIARVRYGVYAPITFISTNNDLSLVDHHDIITEQLKSLPHSIAQEVSKSLSNQLRKTPKQASEQPSKKEVRYAQYHGITALLKIIYSIHSISHDTYQTIYNHLASAIDSDSKELLAAFGEIKDIPIHSDPSPTTLSTVRDWIERQST